MCRQICLKYLHASFSPDIFEITDPDFLWIKAFGLAKWLEAIVIGLHTGKQNKLIRRIIKRIRLNLSHVKSTQRGKNIIPLVAFVGMPGSPL